MKTKLDNIEQKKPFFANLYFFRKNKKVILKKYIFYFPEIYFNFQNTFFLKN